jgi:lauroyl/myristoyl acyltransferase
MCGGVYTDSETEGMRVTPDAGDVARWAFWDPFGRFARTRPRWIALARNAWRLHPARRGLRRMLLEDELRRSFGPAAEAHADASIRAATRARLDDLRLDDPAIRFDGLANLDRALAHGRGVVWLHPHAGPVLRMLAALTGLGYRCSQVAARGLAPDALGDPRHMGSNWFRVRVRRVREADEDRIAAEFLDQTSPVRALHRALAQNAIVDIAFDGRLGRGWALLPFLGREALLSPGPYKLAVQTGALVVPVFCRSEDPMPVCEIGEPIEPTSDWREVARRVLAHAERALARHPEQYGLWLLHCRERRAADDHPLFVDYAPDHRWRRWAEPER